MKTVILEPGNNPTRHAIESDSRTVCGEQIYPGELKRAKEGTITCEECTSILEHQTK